MLESLNHSFKDERKKHPVAQGSVRDECKSNLPSASKKHMFRVASVLGKGGNYYLL